jgi:TPR repeat protein
VRILVSTVVMAAALLPAARAGASNLRAELAQANRALAAQDYPTAYRAYARHAASNPLAQFNLGLMEQHGWGRPANPSAACAWFDKAARKNIPAAQQLLGDCYALGQGRAVDGPAALQWYAKAAAAGVAAADCSAGELYLAGTVVPPDTTRGLALCTKAAQAESVPAMLKLADRYRTAESTLALARFWYDQAAQRHSLSAQWHLGIMLSEGAGGPADVTQARFWLEHAAMDGFAPAYLPTAILYANAPTNPDTGALEPDDLAKTYMWSQAARAITTNPTQLAEIARMETMIKAVMPAQWQPELDRRVAEHLARFASVVPPAAH